MKVFLRVEAVSFVLFSDVQVKMTETFKAVKLPELDTDFDIDTSSVVEAVQALLINIHPDRE